MCPCCSPHNAQGAHCTGELLLYMQILSWDTVWLRLRGSHHVTITSAFSSQYWIRWPLNSYFLIVCKKYRTVPLLSSPVRLAHRYSPPKCSQEIDWWIFQSKCGLLESCNGDAPIFHQTIISLKTLSQAVV